MAMKVVKQDKYNFTYNGTPQTISLILREGKQRRRSYMTGKMEWANVRSLSVVCSLYPKCEWFPYADGASRGATFSCEGWEPDRPEFNTIDNIADALICKEKGWPTDGNVDRLLNELSNTAYEVDESMKRMLEQRIARLEKLLNGKRKVNERNDELARALDFVGRVATNAYNILDDGNVSSDVGDISAWSGNDAVALAYENALTALEDLSNAVASAHDTNDNEM